MSKLITIHAKKEPSLLDVETRFKIIEPVSDNKEFPAHTIEKYDTQVITIEAGFLFDWEVFRSELEFE